MTGISNVDQKTGGIFWRISTEDQSEISPETQIKESLALAKNEGFDVPSQYILGTDWASLSVWESPPMERLKDLVREGAIQRLYMYDADRGPSKPVHRLFLRALCEEYGVQIHCCHGQIPEGEMRDVMDFLSAWAKEKQVLRAQQGAADGLRDRAAIRGLPSVPVAPYGYRWNGSKFEAHTATFHVAKRIWEMALEGSSQRSIAAALTQAGIPSPSGKAHWSPTTISHIVRNPTYRGNYVALRNKSVVPQTRKGSTYGKSTHRFRDVSEQVPLPGLVLEPVVTEEEFQLVQDRLDRNKAQGGKVSQFYLLRGMVRCELCGRRYRGKRQRINDRTYYRYACPGRERPDTGVRCGAATSNGPELEARVWDRVVEFLTRPEIFLEAINERDEGRRDSVEEIEVATKRLEGRRERLDAAEAKAYSGYVRGLASEEAYSRVRSELKAERLWIEDELQDKQTALKSARSRRVTAETVKTLHPKLLKHIQNAAPEDKRYVLECLGAETTVGPSGVQLALAVPESAMSAVHNGPGRAGRATERGGATGFPPAVSLSLLRK